MNKKHKNGISGRYKTPLDNLIFAILAQAAVDSKNNLYKKEALTFLHGDGKEMYDYLKTRPRHSIEKDLKNDGYLTEYHREKRVNK